MTTALHTPAAFRLAPLALCLVLAACGGSSSSRGQLGTLDPLPVPFTDELAPLAAKLAVTHGEVIANAYRNTFARLDDIRSECAAFLSETSEGDATRLEVRQCAFSQQAGTNYYGRDTDILLTYEEDDATPGQLSLDIQRFADNVASITGGLQQQTRITAEGQLTALLGGAGEVVLTDANASFTRHYSSQAQGNNPMVDLVYFQLRDYDLDASPDTDPARYAQHGRVIVSVGGVLGYVDITTDVALETQAGESCPFVGDVTVLGRDDDEMSITFAGDDITVVTNGNSEAYDCDSFRAWIDPT